jgi:hypothetical protein
MERAASEAEKAKFPGVFVRHKGHKDPATVTQLTNQLGGGNMKSDSEMDSPHSNLSEEEFAISSCTSSCSVTTSSAQIACQGAPLPNGLSSECGMTISDSEAISSTEELDGSIAKLRRSKRKKSKDKSSEENGALDPVRYKTKMCKNWQQSEKCPYGPRCLFAHGTKEMRTYSLNSNAITTACTAASPERQFYSIGHFPNFMPVPFNNSETASVEAANEEEVETQSVETETRADSTVGQYTHSPYSSVAPPCVLEAQQPLYPSVDHCSTVPAVLHDPYFSQRAYHTQVPMFPQLPFPPECAMYAPQFSHLTQYHMAATDMYPLPYFHPVR